MKKSLNTSIIFCFFIFFPFVIVHADEINLEGINKYLLPNSHPIKMALDKIICSPETFSNFQSMIENGFIDKNSSGIKQDWCIHVVSHPCIEGYLIKTYNINKKDEHYKKVLPRYIKRIINSEKVRSYIVENDCQYLTVPKKWLYRLPDRFSDQDSPYGKFLLIVEDLYVLPGSFGHGENGFHYHNIPEEHMYELLTALFKLKGCDAWPQNIPFTKDNKLAFVDLDLLGRTLGDVTIHIIPYFRPEMQTVAKQYWLMLFL